MNFGVYVAAPFAQASFVRIVHDHLRDLNITPTATWPDHAQGPEDFARFSPDALRRALAMNSRDLRASDVVLVYDPAGQGRETYAEAARALEWGKALVWCGPRGLSQFARGVIRVSDLDEAIAKLARMRNVHAHGYRGVLLADVMAEAS